MKKFAYLTSLLILCPLFANADMYIGLSVNDMTYQQGNVLRALMDDDDPNYTGVSWVYNYQGQSATDSAQRAYLIRGLDDVSGSDLSKNSRLPKETSFDFHIQAFNVKLGYSFNNWLSLEVRLGAGTSPAKIDSYSEKIKKTKLITIKEASPSQPVFGDFIDELHTIFADEIYGTSTTFREFDAQSRDEPRGCSPEGQAAGEECKQVNDSVKITETIPQDSQLRTELLTGMYFRIGGGFDFRRFSPYLIAGSTHAKFVVNDDQGTGGGTVEDLSLGAGFNFELTEKMYFNVEYLDLIDKENIKVENWSAGIEYFFD